MGLIEGPGNRGPCTSPESNYSLSVPWSRNHCKVYAEVLAWRSIRNELKSVLQELPRLFMVFKCWIQIEILFQKTNPGEVDSSVDIVAYGTKYSSSPFQIYFCSSSLSSSHKKPDQKIWTQKIPDPKILVQNISKHFLRFHFPSVPELSPRYFSDFLHYYESFSQNFTMSHFSEGPLPRVFFIQDDSLFLISHYPSFD